MDVDPTIVELDLFTDRSTIWLVNERWESIPRRAGVYNEQLDKTIIHLESSQVGDPMTLVGMIAHELAHFQLLGERRISIDIFDNEILTDLTVAFHGMGIFLANVPRVWKSGFSNWPGTNARKPEYMTPQMFGYTLAHAAWHRNEQKPSWAQHLRTDARCAFKQGLRYLWETNDSEFTPE